MKILFVEDEEVLGELVKEALEKNEYLVQWAKDGKEALKNIRKFAPDLCILDIMLPQTDGYELAKEIRQIDKDIPIIFLSSKIKTDDVIKGFESGGNDYLKKPFSIEELHVRVQELLRRSKNYAEKKEGTASYSIGKYLFLPSKQCLILNDKVKVLTYKASNLLEELICNKNNLLRRSDALIKIWGDDNFFNARTMDVYIVKLRKYLAEDDSIAIINVRGYGYKLIEKVQQ
jgi:DNA-binding response OmpR family regulator